MKIDIRQIRGVLITCRDQHSLPVRTGLAEQAVNQFFLGGAHLPLPVEKMKEDVQTLAVLLAKLLEEHLPSLVVVADKRDLKIEFEIGEPLLLNQ
jgi:hypothetical protein